MCVFDKQGMENSEHANILYNSIYNEIRTPGIVEAGGPDQNKP